METEELINTSLVVGIICVVMTVIMIAVDIYFTRKERKQ